jgi:hypothetical protein
MINYLVYDCEIKKCIPDRNGVIDANLDYCEGWHDHANMGMSVVGVMASAWRSPAAWTDVSVYDDDEYMGGWYENNPACLLFRNDNEVRPIKQMHDAFQQSNLAEWFEYNKGMATIGFNSKNFDDKLLQANGVNAKTDYDLLEEIRLAAFGSTRRQDTPKGCSYSLGKLGEANGFPKTGSGELAPVLWQQGRHEEVIKYCMNDVKITHELLLLGWAGELVDPNTGKKLRTRSLDEVLSTSVAPL